MGQITRCPLVGTPCAKPITVEEKTFFLAEAEKPDYDKTHRNRVIKEAIVNGYKIKSALEEKGINAFTCKICEMIQNCAYGMADISQNNANVFMELGIMLALGKPTIIFAKKGQEQQLKLPSDVIGIEVIPFDEYLDIIDPLRECVKKLPTAVAISTPIENLEKIDPQISEKLEIMRNEIVKEFKKSVEEAKIDVSSSREEKKELTPELNERLHSLEEKLGDLKELGLIADAETSSLRGDYFFSQSKYKEALASYNWALELKPDYFEAVYSRGNTYHMLEKYDEALIDFNRALKLKPDDIEALISRGATYSQLKKYNEAITDFNHALKLKPDYPKVLSNRGAAYSQLKKYNEAITDFNRAFKLKPDYPSALYNLACLFSVQSKTDDALKYLEKAISKDKKYKEMAKKDKDFDNIRNDPRFKKLIGED
jgi:tetratricopeptide (TPR) repeat protein